MKLLRQYRISLVFLVVFWLMPRPIVAWNQLPLLTDSPKLLPAGSVRLALGVQYLSKKTFLFTSSSESEGQDILSLPVLGLDIGLGRRVELQMTYEFLFVKEDDFDIDEQWQIGDLGVFTKIEILQERQTLPGIGVKFGAKLPNANDENRIGTNKTDLALSALFEKTFAPLITTANLGVLILGNPLSSVSQDDLLSYGFACSLPWKDHATFTAEIAGQTWTSHNNQRSSALLHVYIPYKALTWNISGRVGLVEESEDWGVFGGVRWTSDVLTRWASGQ